LPDETRKEPPDRDLRARPSPDWLTLDDVIYTRDKRFGAIGALLVFFGAFVPWGPVPWWGPYWGWYNAPQAWLVALGGIAAGVFLFRKRSGSIVMVIGIVVAAWTVLIVLSILSSNVSPSLGVALTLAGSGLLAYSGHLTNQYERGGGER
jgi:hypothetical protein